MSTARRLHYSYAQYLEIERMSSVKHEYLDGEIYARPGGTPQHGMLASRIAALVSQQLPTECRGASSDVKVTVLATGLATYPDWSVVCGKMQTDPKDPHAVTNPTLIVEVTSPSTEDYDRGDKLSHYKQIESVQAIVIVSHSSKRLTVVARDGQKWAVRDYRPGERATFGAPSVELGVDEVYSALDGL